LTAYEYGPGIVLRFGGEIDAANAQVVAQAIGPFSRLQVPLILDVSQVDFLGVAGFRALIALAREPQPVCAVRGTALRRLMRIFTDTGLPVADSVPEAVQRIKEMLNDNNFHRAARKWAVSSS
jgi:anti-anti-sigma factor